MAAAKVLLYVGAVYWLLKTGAAEPFIAAAICSSWATVQDRLPYLNQWWSTNSSLVQGVILLDEPTNATYLKTLKLPPGIKTAFPWRTPPNVGKNGGGYESAAGRRCGWGQVMNNFNIFPNATYYLGLDDDTFVSLSNLESMLQAYDPDKKWYIGGRSETLVSELVSLLFL